ncbi:MAG: hypothetical protein KDD51_08450 [Bdellovibrionales bacterium]|nr:hypothetical protein [Bdellovibrionales bacterium]
MKALRTWAEKISESLNTSNSKKALTAQAAKIAHDIRSPLSALLLLREDLTTLPEEKRLLVEQALVRLQDITNNLLNTPDASPPPPVACTTERRSTQWLLPLAEGLISEARANGGKIDAPKSTELYGSFAWVPRDSFARSLSELFALSDNSLKVSLETEGDRVAFVFQFADKLDNKCAAEIFSQVQTRAECWGGRFDILGDMNPTRVRLTVPRAEPPTWFVPRLVLSEKTDVFCLDDDPSVHPIWERRLKRSAAGQRVAFFTDGGAFAAALRSNHANERLCLMDYELEGQAHTGIELICELGLQTQAILVTGCYDNPSLQVECEKLGIRLLPKPLAASVPIEWADENLEETILIEDDPLVRNMWRLAAKSENQTLRVFEQPSDFFRAAHLVSLKSRIYVDVELANGERGEKISRQIADLGFTNIFLTTGHPTWRFGALPWVRGIIGKAPPWGFKIDGTSVAIGQPRS